MHDCHPQLSPYTLTGAPSQYNQSCKMLICFLTCTSLLIPRVIFNLQSFIATRQRGRRASIKYQREGVDLPPSHARKDAKERVGATMKSPCLYTRLCTYLHIPSYYDLYSSCAVGFSWLAGSTVSLGGLNSSWLSGWLLGVQES